MNRPNYGGNSTAISTNNISSNYFGGSNTYVANSGGWGGGWGGGRGGWGGGSGGWGSGWGGGGYGGWGGGWGGGSGGWGGGGYGGWGGGWGGGPGWGGGWGGGYGGWASPFYGNWYRGNWGGSGFLTGLGLGALASAGFGTALGATGFGYGAPFYGSGIYSYFPTWIASDYGSWGLGSLTGGLLAANYSNPYYAAVVAAQPASTTIVYDYSQPINVTAAPPSESVAESAEQVFSAARDAFKAGDYPRAIELADQVLKETPNAPVIHEFRALALFAQKRYDEAAAVVYAVLSAGPGWNWATLVNLYPDVDTYTTQLRALEAYVGSNPDSSSGQFLLAYHYMVQGHNEAAAAAFERVTKIQPNETLSASFVKALRKASEAAAQQNETAAPVATPVQPSTGESTTAPQATSSSEAAKPSTPPAETPVAEPPPPPEMAGKWTAKPSPDVTVSFVLQTDGTFSWEVDEKGRKQTIQGHAGFKDDTLALIQTNGPPLVGKVTRDGNDKFVFAPPGTNSKAPGLTFTR